MSEIYSPAGNVSAQSYKRATIAEAATGTFGDEFMRQDMTQIADRLRFLDDNGFPNLSKIMFPAVQVPSAGANDLDDYEEGTFTPILQFGGASVGMTYTTQAGQYTKVGRLVTGCLIIILSAKGSSVGAAQIAGLPFSANGAGTQSAVQTFGINLGTAFVAHHYANSTVIVLQKGNLTSAAGLADTDFTNTTRLDINFVFLT
jgi:hypothetical protein